MPAKGRIDVQYPHCGNIQLEPELAKYTYRKNMQRLLSAKQPDSKQGRAFASFPRLSQIRLSLVRRRSLNLSVERSRTRVRLTAVANTTAAPTRVGEGKMPLVLSDCRIRGNLTDENEPHQGGTRRPPTVTAQELNLVMVGA